MNEKCDEQFTYVFLVVLKVYLLVVTSTLKKIVIEQISISCQCIYYLILLMHTTIQVRKINTDTLYLKSLILLFFEGKYGQVALYLKDATLSLNKLREGYVEVCLITTVFL